MTIYEAIKTMEYFDHNFGDYEPNHEAIQMAIEALSCSEKPNRSDLINRQAAINEIEERKNANGYHNVAVISELNRLEGYIMRLPSAQPVGYVHINDVYRLISGHSNYHGDNILAALTCLAEGKDVPNPIRVLEERKDNG